MFYAVPATIRTRNSVSSSDSRAWSRTAMAKSSSLFSLSRSAFAPLNAPCLVSHLSDTWHNSLRTSFCSSMIPSDSKLLISFCNSVYALSRSSFALLQSCCWISADMLKNYYHPSVNLPLIGLTIKPKRIEIEFTTEHIMWFLFQKSFVCAEACAIDFWLYWHKNIINMGVPAFFRWLSRKYPSIVVHCVEEKVTLLTRFWSAIGINFQFGFPDLQGRFNGWASTCVVIVQY